MFEIQITAPQLSGKWYRIFTRIFDKRLRAADREIKELLLFEAKEKHRYKHKTYNLRDSTTVKGSLLTKKGILVAVNLGKAKYGRYIIEGWSKWAPDPFIEMAVKRNEGRIQAILDRAANGAAAEFNRIK